MTVPWVEIAILVVLAMAILFAFILLHRTRRNLRAVVDAVERASARGRELTQRLEVLDRLENNQRLTEHALRTGANVVKDVHRGIADIPFSILEGIPTTAPSARVARRLHDRIAGDVYGALAGINKSVGKHLREGIGKEDSRSDTTPDKPSGTPKSE